MLGAAAAPHSDLLWRLCASGRLNPLLTAGALLGVCGSWMRRRDEATTFMEVYEGVADERAFEAVLARESAALGLERKTERFICA